MSPCLPVIQLFQVTAVSAKESLEAREKLESQEFWIPRAGNHKTWLKGLCTTLLDSGGVKSEALLLSRPLCLVSSWKSRGTFVASCNCRSGRYVWIYLLTCTLLPPPISRWRWTAARGCCLSSSTPSSWTTPMVHGGSCFPPTSRISSVSVPGVLRPPVGQPHLSTLTLVGVGPRCDQLRVSEPLSQ